MKWKQRTRPVPPKPGDEREISKFLFLPRTINGETRWLERARIRQRAYLGYSGVERMAEVLKWRDVKWIDCYSIRQWIQQHPWPRPK